MDERSLLKALADIPLGGLRTYAQTGSTNDVALAWAADGAADLTLVLAEEQTAGRGRGDRRWFSGPGSGLAFSLILRPKDVEGAVIPLFSGLGALAVCEALERLGLRPEIKWPNDVLLDRKKLCGILVETVWRGDEVDSIILGIGVNIKPESVPLPEQLNFPATCLEAELGKKVDRQVFLHDILLGLQLWRGLLTGDEFLRAWDEHLAFRGELVEIQALGTKPRQGQLVSLGPDGALRLRDQDGRESMVRFGEVHLRPVV